MQVAQQNRLEAVQALITAGADVNRGDMLGTSALHLAATEGHTNVVDLLIASGADINHADEDGFTAVMLAVRKDHPAAFQSLLDAQADLLCGSANGDTLLHLAAKKGNVVILRQLLAHEKLRDLINNLSKEGRIAVHYAASGGHIECLQALIDAGANVSLKTLEDDTLLHIAAEGKQSKMLRRLLDHPLIRGHLNHQNEDELTPLLVAAVAGSAACFDALFSAGADLSLLPSDGSNVVHLVARRGSLGMLKHVLSIESIAALVDVRNERGGTPLLSAMRHGTLECIEHLLSLGVDQTAKTKTGFTALHLAAGRPTSEFIRRLLEFDQIRRIINQPDLTGQTPLMTAVLASNAETVDVLLDAGADVSLRTEKGRTALHLASTTSIKCLPRIISQCRAVINARDEDGETPLMMFAGSELWRWRKGMKEEILKCFLEAGADVMLANKKGETATAIALPRNKELGLLLKAHEEYLQKLGQYVKPAVRNPAPLQLEPESAAVEPPGLVVMQADQPVLDFGAASEQLADEHTPTQPLVDVNASIPSQCSESSTEQAAHNPLVLSIDISDLHYDLEE
eukprot:m.554570 g.554570  ORF g.554570 m.554570 type:complete len:570 (+) comp57751_c0_seq22:220-1929(+)